MLYHRCFPVNFPCQLILWNIFGWLLLISFSLQTLYALYLSAIIFPRERKTDMISNPISLDFENDVAGNTNPRYSHRLPHLYIER